MILSSQILHFPCLLVGLDKIYKLMVMMVVVAAVVVVMMVKVVTEMVQSMSVVTRNDDLRFTDSSFSVFTEKA